LATAIACFMQSTMKFVRDPALAQTGFYHSSRAAISDDRGEPDVVHAAALWQVGFP